MTNSEIIRECDIHFANLVEREVGPLEDLVIAATRNGGDDDAAELERAGVLMATYIGGPLNDSAEPHVDLVLYVKNAGGCVDFLSYIEDSRDAN